MGESYLLSTAAALLAQAVAAQGRYEEAAELVEQGQALAAEDDVGSVTLLAGVRSGILIRRGDVTAAVTEARRAVAEVQDADASYVRGEAFSALATALAAAGDIPSAVDVFHQAIAEYAAKGNVVAERRARDALDRYARQWPFVDESATS